MTYPCNGYLPLLTFKFSRPRDFRKNNNLKIRFRIPTGMPAMAKNVRRIQNIEKRKLRMEQRRPTVHVRRIQDIDLVAKQPNTTQKLGQVSAIFC